MERPEGFRRFTSYLIDIPRNLNWNNPFNANNNAKRRKKKEKVDTDLSMNQEGSVSMEDNDNQRNQSNYRMDQCLCPCVAFTLMMAVTIISLEILVFVGLNRLQDDIKNAREYPGDQVDAMLINQELHYIRNMVQLVRGGPGGGPEPPPENPTNWRQVRVVRETNEKANVTLEDVYNLLKDAFGSNASIATQLTQVQTAITAAGTHLDEITEKDKKLDDQMNNIVETQKKIIKKQGIKPTKA